MHEALQAELSLLPTRTFAPGEVLLSAGTRTGCLFFLEMGRIGVRRDGLLISRVREPGAVFGEMSILLHVPHTAEVVALEPTVCRVIEDAQSYLLARPAMMAHVAAVLAQRLEAATRYLVDVKAQLGETAGHLGMIDEVLTSIAHHQPRGIPAEARLS